MEYAVLTFPAFWYIENHPDVSQVDFAAEKTEKCFQFAQDKRDVLRYNKETAILHNLTKAESMKPSPTKKLTAHSAGTCLLVTVLLFFKSFSKFRKRKFRKKNRERKN